MRRLAAAAAVVAAVVSAATAVADEGAKVRVSPHRGGPAKVFVVGFTAPRPSGHEGVIERSYSVTATRRSRAGCTWSAFAPAAASQAGERVRVRLKPTSSWCRGRFKGRVTMDEGPYCQPDQPPCPARTAATRPCPMTSGAYGCGCCPPPPQSDRPIKCPEATAGDCCGASDCSPPPSFPSRSAVLGRFSFRIR